MMSAVENVLLHTPYPLLPHFMAIIKHDDQRVGFFIDTQNLYHSAKNLYDDARVNFGAMVKDAVAGRKLVRALAYVISTKTGEESSFFDALGKIGIETRVKELQEFWGGAKKGDWDVGMAVDAIRLAPKLDTVILATGDGDFIPLVEYLQNQGCQVEVVSFGKSTSGKLKEAADDFFDLSDNPSAYLLGHRERRSSTPRQPSAAPKQRPERGGTRRAVSL